MVSVLLHCDIEEKDSLIAELWAMETTGVVEHEQPGGECTLEAFFESVEQARVVAGMFPACRPEIREHGRRDYVKEFEEQWPARAVGSRLWLVGPWDPAPAPEGRLRLEYQAGMACGSGAHPCTRLCLEALEECVRPGAAVLDAGVGSGILLLAARALGAGAVAGCDIDHEATAHAMRALPDALLFTGSVDAIRGGAFDVVIANISSVAAEDMAADLRRVCRTGGVVIVSGFRGDEIPVGYSGGRRDMEGWVCMVERG